MNAIADKSTDATVPVLDPGADASTGTTARPREPDELTVTEALELAVRYHRADQLDVAESVYRRVLEVVPEQPDAQHFLGVVHRAQGQPDGAADAYRRAIEIDPRHADAYHNMGNLLIAQGRVKEAVTCLCTSITLRPPHPETRRLLG